MNRPEYIKWLIEEAGVVFEDGIPLNCYKLDYCSDEEVFNDWALHLRRHYTFDEELEESLALHKITAAEYLRKFVIPQKDEGFGPAARSSDITEILIADLFQFVLHYTVPRCKQHNRSGKTQSEHGTDILAYKFERDDKKPKASDELLAIEVKSGISDDSYNPIGNAVRDSQEYDEHRHALTLDYYRKKLKYMSNYEQSKEIARFQQKTEFPYKTTYVGAGIVSKTDIENSVLIGVTGESLRLRSDNKVFLVHGTKLMELTHEIFERCIK